MISNTFVRMKKEIDNQTYAHAYEKPSHNNERPTTMTIPMNKNNKFLIKPCYNYVY